MTKLKAELADKGKKATNNRAGALCAMRKMMETAAAISEPYLVADLPLILEASSDKMKPVSIEADGLAKGLVNALSAQGVRAVLPAILAEGDGKTQTNQLRAELLSILAKKAPAQMSRCLTDAVPVLSGLMWDVKAQVKEAATKAITDGAPPAPRPPPLSTHPHARPATPHARSRPTVRRLPRRVQSSRATRTRTSRSSCRR